MICYSLVAEYITCVIQLKVTACCSCGFIKSVYIIRIL